VAELLSFNSTHPDNPSAVIDRRYNFFSNSDTREVRSCNNFCCSVMVFSCAAIVSCCFRLLVGPKGKILTELTGFFMRGKAIE